MSLLKNLGRAMVEHWFPVLLAAIGVGAIVIALDVPAPEPLPQYALQAEALYRAQVMGAWFAIPYLMVMAVGLAFSGRGFIRFGPRGVEAGTVFKRARARRKTARAIRDLQAGLRKVQPGLEALTAGLGIVAGRQDEAIEEQSAQAARIEVLEQRLDEVNSDNQGLKDELSRLHRKIDTEHS